MSNKPYDTSSGQSESQHSASAIPDNQATAAGRGGSGPAPSRQRPRRRRRGSAVMEAALALPVLLYFSMGMIEFGQFFYAKHTVQSAARDACRQAIVGTSTCQTATDAAGNTMSAAGFGSSGYTLVFSNPSSSGQTYSGANWSTVTSGSGIKATITVNYSAVGVRPLGVIPANKQIIGVTTMIKE